MRAHCVFCEIAAGREPASFVQRDSELLAFMSNAPVNPGHLLVVPRDHAASLAELAPDLAASLFRAAQRFGIALQRSALRCEGLNLFLADGAVASQRVPHVHLHVIPRFEGDSFKLNPRGGVTTSEGTTPRAGLDVAAAALRTALADPGPAVEAPSFAELLSERLVLRRFGPADAEPLAAYRSDPDVARYQAWECPYSLHEAETFIAGLRGRAPGTPGTWFQFAVGLRPSGALIGDVGLRTTRSDPRQAELGFTFAGAHQGRGYATEAVRGVVTYAFGRLAMHRVFSLTDGRNLPAQRLLERLGFRREGALRENTWFKGGWASDLLYARLASDRSPEHTV